MSDWVGGHNRCNVHVCMLCTHSNFCSRLPTSRHKRLTCMKQQYRYHMTLMVSSCLYSMYTCFILSWVLTLMSWDELGTILPSSGETERAEGSWEGELDSWNRLAAVPELVMVKEAEAIWLAITRRPNSTAVEERVRCGDGGSLEKRKNSSLWRYIGTHALSSHPITGTASTILSSANTSNRPSWRPFCSSLWVSLSGLYWIVTGSLSPAATTRSPVLETRRNTYRRTQQFRSSLVPGPND